MAVAYVGFGSNLGDKVGYIREASKALQAHEAVHRFRLSSFYRTAPVGKTDQDWFVNAVGEMDTNLSPKDLLEACADIENALKRIRGIRWGPRTIDLDLLLYDDDSVETEELKIPHPRMHDRAFVLVPLAELAPDLRLRGRKVGDVIADIDCEGVALLKD